MALNRFIHRTASVVLATGLYIGTHGCSRGVGGGLTRSIDQSDRKVEVHTHESQGQDSRWIAGVLLGAGFFGIIATSYAFIRRSDT